MFKDIQKNNISWTVKEGLDESILEDLYPRLSDFTACPEFSVVKDNNVRTVLFLKPEEGASEQVFIKLYKKGDLGEKLKHLLVPSKAFSEWQKLRHFDEIGLACPKPLAFSERKRFGLLNESCLLISAIPLSFPLTEYIKKGTLPFNKKRRIVIALACLIRDLHNNNVFYRDLHGGNILIKEKGASGFELFFIDLHRAALLGKISERMKIQDIAQLCNSVLCSETERLLFLKKYLGENGEDRKSLKSFSRKVAAKRGKRGETRIKSRSKRCLKNSSVFETIKNSNETYYGRKDFGKKEVDEVLSLHALNKENNSGPILKISEKSVITVIEREGKEPLCVKEYRFVSILYLLKNLFRKSRAMKSWVAANGLMVRGIETPLPLALIEKKSGPFVIKGYIVTRFMKEAKEVNDFINVFKGPAKRTAKLEFIKACAMVFKKLHDREIYHADLKSNNILVKDNGDGPRKFFFIDLDRVLFGKELTFYQRTNNLAQLNASISSLMTVKDRLNFFYFYAKDTHLYQQRKKYYQKILEISRTKKQRYIE